MKVQIEGTPEEIAELLQAIRSSEERSKCIEVSLSNNSISELIKVVHDPKRVNYQSIQPLNL
ncbi:hypothetical protein [Enterococcus pallens]|uniref:Uncharacterized protein n=1 Tax=Enterococcus pallens ATCC BAA-351 TaxID=1158607 RepID=R2T3L4_9ENTE|nr:hypothetical protein [Enterococcus pallens]EOH94829.1 hypothetical protein UAU_01751 [Enterococcus pallens ATCC BAA-351]EOU14852.1 hypothetical protein I588_04502 [Enterococcus pallens ATCC BAA-351]